AEFCLRRSGGSSRTPERFHLRCDPCGGHSPDARGGAPGTRRPAARIDLQLLFLIMILIPDPASAIFQLAQTPGGGDSLHGSFQFFATGGFFMLLLVLTSVVAMMAIVFKILTLRRERIIPEA